MRRARAKPTSTKAANGRRRPPDQAARVLRQFRQIFNAVKRHFQQVEKVAGLGGAQVWALSVIAAEPGIGINALAAALDIHQTTASNLVKALLTEGLIDSRRGGHDRRTVALRILPAGRAVLRRAPGPFAGVLPQALARLDDRAVARLHRDLSALISVLKADRRAAHIPLAD